MLSTWWTNGGEDAWYESGFDAVTATMSNLNDLWDMYVIEVDTAYQRSYHYGGTHDMLNGGYVYLLNTASDEVTYAADVMATAGQPLSPDPSYEGDIQEFNGEAARYLMAMTNGDSSTYPVTLTAIVTTTPAGDVSNWGPFHLYHYQPWAWYGYPAEVVASMLLRLGINEDWLDTDSFDDAYDGEVNDFSSGVYAPKVYVSREVGRPVVELVKEVVRHSHDGLFYNMKGQIAMASRTRPTYATLDTDDGIISLSWKYTDEHLCNIARFSYGQVVRLTQDDRDQPPTQISSSAEVPNSDYKSRAAWESSGQSQMSDLWAYDYSDATSITDYGEYPLGGERMEVDEAGNTTTVPVTHFRLFGGGGSIQGLAERIDYEHEMRRELTVVQDFRGLDYDVGHVVAGVQLTSDGATIPFMRCISKEIDFNNKTVTSVFLEHDITVPT